MLTAMEVKYAKPGKLSVGKHGLYLVTKASGAQSWVVRYRDADGKRRDTGIGSVKDITLAQASRIAESIQADGAPAPEPEPAAMTFAAAAAEVAAKLRGTKWKRNPEERETVMWSRFRRFAGELLDMAVADISPAHVYDVVMAVEKPDTARLLRSDIRRVIGGVMFRLDLTANPAGEALDDALIRAAHVAKRRRSIHHSEVGDALDIVDRSGHSDAVRLCLRLLTLTATRSQEARGARWDEFHGNEWLIPMERMKSGPAHRVPLSRQALVVLGAAKVSAGDSPYLFVGYRGRPISAEALRHALSANCIDAVPHGMRSSFKTWALENGKNRYTVEAALAHTLGENPVEAAYIRTDLFDKRRSLMAEWADYIAPAAVR